MYASLRFPYPLKKEVKMAKEQKFKILEIENWNTLPIIVNGIKAQKFLQANFAQMANTTQRY
jgi:hypothetical protein